MFATHAPAPSSHFQANTTAVVESRKHLQRPVAGAGKAVSARLLTGDEDFIGQIGKSLE